MTSVGASVIASVGASVAGGGAVVAGAQAAKIMTATVSRPRILLILNIYSSPILINRFEFLYDSLHGILECYFVSATTSFTDASTCWHPENQKIS
jgi:hypothetical protein